eukprot:1137258-Pelagomonas_calceolata.AAC.1
MRAVAGAVDVPIACSLFPHCQCQWLTKEMRKGLPLGPALRIPGVATLQLSWLACSSEKVEQLKYAVEAVEFNRDSTAG